jgi:hypothetical protein
MLGVFLMRLYWVGKLCHTFCSWSTSEWQLLGISVSRQAIRTTAWRDKHRPEKIKVQAVSCNVLIAILFSSSPRCWLLIWVIRWVEESVQLSHILARAEVHRFFKSLRSYLKILDTKRVTWSKFSAKDPQILGATVQNLYVVATVTWRPGFVYTWTRVRGGRPRIRGSIPGRGTVYLVHNVPTGSKTHRVPNHWISTSASLFTFVAWCLTKLAGNFVAVKYYVSPAYRTRDRIVVLPTVFWEALRMVTVYCWSITFGIVQFFCL